MARNNKNYDDNTEYDALQEAIRFGTIEVTSLFEPDNKSFKLSFGGSRSLRIRYATLIGGGIFGFLAFLISFAIFMIFGQPFMLIPLLFGFVFACAFIGAKLGTWSPMQKSTGEDLITYIMIILRKRISTNESFFGNKRPSTVELNSLAVSKSSGGRIVECQVYLGTQPVYNSPKINPYDFSEKTPLYFEPRGEARIYPNELYEDEVPRKG